jgi:hypothetical protein
VRDGDYRLIEFFEDHRVELYNLKTDPLEKVDLAAQSPEIVARMRKQLASWRKQTGAQLPLKNPDYRPGVRAAMLDLD